MAPKKAKKKKEKPVDKRPIAGTSWLRVTTNEGNVFYTNTETKTSVWTVPDEIKEQVELQLSSAAKDGSRGDEAARILAEKEAEMQRLREELEQEREASRKRKLQGEEEQGDEEQVRAQKIARPSVTVQDDAEYEGGGADGRKEHDLNVEAEQEQDQEQDPEQDPEPEPLEDWQLDELRLKAEMEAELETPARASAAESHTGFSSEESIALFRTMLAEKDINPMKPWDMELPKFISDPRYKAVKSLRERRDLFDEHCKHKVREARLLKAATGQKQKKADPATAYRALLVAEVTSTRTRWEDFRSKHKKDPRFRDFGRDDRERERVFRNWLRELGEIKRADAEAAVGKFTQMLTENAASLPIAADASWASVKGKLASDPRYSLIASSSQREEAFKKFQTGRASAAMAVSNTAGEQEEQKKHRAEQAEERKRRQAASLREREEKVRREREALDKAAGRSRAEAGREESEREYRSLLIDAVRDHEVRVSFALAFAAALTQRKVT